MSNFAGMLAVAMGVAFLIYLLPSEPAAVSYDDSDNPPARSGLDILTDCRTGLQYLTTPSGGLTPRLGLDVSQIAEPCA